jgi:predicted PP-loop superfamily ATPase
MVGSMIAADNKNVAIALPQMVKEECEANARLIAAAPKLVEALEALIITKESQHSSVCLCVRCEGVVDKAKSALAAAYGSASTTDK